jgi:ABC-type branched-subunit amino acid transport system substrate-binding protein
MLASEILKSNGKKVKYVTFPDARKRPSVAAELQKLCANYKVGAVLGPGNSELLTSFRAISQFYALPLISPITVRPDKLPQLEYDNYVSFFPPLEKWVDAILTHMKENKVKKILIITPGNGTYGEIFSSVLERNSKDILNDFQVYRMTYPHPLRTNYFNNSLTNYGGQHQVDAIFFGGVAEELPELLQILQNHNIKLPVYVSDDIIRNEIKNPQKTSFKLFLPEAKVPVSNSQWLNLYVKKYKVQPSYHAILGAETMFVMAEKFNSSTYTPETFVETMEQASQAFNKKIKINIIDFSTGKL